MSSSALPLEGAVWRPSYNPWLIAVSVMLGTFMEVLDTSIANVALRNIAGSLSATPEEATWVLTSYLVSNAIILPATGWLASRFGRKRLLMACMAIFTVASVLCGSATSLNMLILARVLQGAGGGALQPIAQAVMLESFPPRKRGVAMAAYGMGVVVAPIIGPTLGGWITDTYSWRWAFYINLPVGLLAMFMVQTFVEDPPYIRRLKGATIDYIGFAAMTLWLATLQIMLDKGQEEDWLSSPFIRWLAALSLIAMVFFIIWELRVEHPIVNLRVFKNRNFAVGTTMILIVGVVLYGTIALLPLFLQTLMGYPAVQSGLAISPRGFGSIVSMILIGRLIGLIDDRFLVAFGFAVLSYATFQFGRINFEISSSVVVWPNIISGFAMGFIFVPMTTLSMGTLSNEQMGNATGLYNLMRNLGGGIGIALVTTLLARSAQAHQALMSAHTTMYDPAFTMRLKAATLALSSQVGSAQAAQQAHGLLYSILGRNALLWAYVSDFRLLAFLCLACVPAVFVFKKVTHHGPPSAAH